MSKPNPKRKPKPKPSPVEPAEIQPPPPPPSMDELMATARRIQAQSDETIRQLALLREEIRTAREGGEKPGGK